MCFEIANKFKVKIRKEIQSPRIREIKLKKAVEKAQKLIKS